MTYRLLVYLTLLLWGVIAYAEDLPKQRYQVEIEAPAPLKSLLQKHLEMIKLRDNPRMTPAEWQRLALSAPQNIKDLLATEGFFSPIITPLLTTQNIVSIATFTVEPGTPILIQQVALTFTGDIMQQSSKDLPDIQKLRDDWLLKSGMQFRQENWSQAKRNLLTALLILRYPNASISKSSATVNIESNTAALMVEIDSGSAVHFGKLSIEGLKRYPDSIIENLNPIKTGSVYSQSQLLIFQSRLQESRYFRSVEVIADTKTANADGSPVVNAPIKVMVDENQAIKMGVGAGYSTNTGARTQLTFDDLNLFNLGLRMTSSLKLEQKVQALAGEVRLPPTKQGYRDSINANVNHTSIEGQSVTSTQAGIKRAWGSRKREQYVGANLLTEQVKLDGAESSSNYAATLAYGITLRRIDHDLNPTRGYLLNVQFAGAPLASLANGTFLQSYIKAQGYYPITASTQLIARAEIGMVNGKNSAPVAFLFRAGGDQSVRGYGFQSLGVAEADAIVGGRYLTTGSVEVVQWLTPQWGAAMFVDFGNAANTLQDLKPVYGYGLGARWKSPVGPIGADIAYGQETDEYRMHFNIGVAF
ncbi:MAG: autotransporter assembly complex family protein [Methylotenera sp.]|nr:autotransporter assembly complex family protein [Methylotenera sp.]MDP1958522.1 autotransporter assembly complex family protein [Methylotenera sp.]MDP3944000.1 autotransporter assembly complex family protein [Methylotenera sp.]